MEQRGWELNNFKKLVQKAVDMEAKAVFWPQSYIRNTNWYCLWSSRPAHSTTAKILSQGHQMKDLRVEKSKKPQELKAPAPQCFENVETFEKARKEKKNNRCHWRGYRPPKDGRPQKRSTPATGVNNTSIARDGNSRKNKNRGARQDPAQAIYWNYNKNGYFANKYPQPPKLKN